MEQKVPLEEMLARMERQLGAEPKPMKLLAQVMPEAVYDHARMRQFVDACPAIPQKYKLLMFVAIAAALGSTYCTETYAQLALNNGATKEEIAEALVVARFVNASTVWATGLTTLERLASL